MKPYLLRAKSMLGLGQGSSLVEIQFETTFITPNHYQPNQTQTTPLPQSMFPLANPAGGFVGGILVCSTVICEKILRKLSSQNSR